MSPVQHRSVRLRTTDIIGVIPTPPAIRTTRGASWPANTNLPAGADTLTRLPSRHVSCRWCEAWPSATRFTEISQ